jgi:hypothetical protein
MIPDRGADTNGLDGRDHRRKVRLVSHPAFVPGTVICQSIGGYRSEAAFHFCNLCWRLGGGKGLSCFTTECLDLGSGGEVCVPVTISEGASVTVSSTRAVGSGCVEI